MIWVLCLHILVFVGGDVYVGGRGDRIRGSDEPQLVSYRVLEGVTEPFEALRPDGDIPTWKLMKAAADNKAAVRMAHPPCRSTDKYSRTPTSSERCLVRSATMVLLMLLLLPFLIHWGTLTSLHSALYSLLSLSAAPSSVPQYEQVTQRPGLLAEG